MKVNSIFLNTIKYSLKKEGIFRTRLLHCVVKATELCLLLYCIFKTTVYFSGKITFKDKYTEYFSTLYGLLSSIQNIEYFYVQIFVGTTLKDLKLITNYWKSKIGLSEKFQLCS